MLKKGLTKKRGDSCSKIRSSHYQTKIKDGPTCGIGRVVARSHFILFYFKFQNDLISVDVIIKRRNFDQIKIYKNNVKLNISLKTLAAIVFNYFFVDKIDYN